MIITEKQKDTTMIETTLHRLNEMRLYTMADRVRHLREAGRYTSLGHDELLAFIVDAEYDTRHKKKIDRLRWNWMEETTFFDYFTVERLFVFLLQLEMIERWISLDKEKGSQLFRSIIAALKDEVRIPAEFR